MWHSHKEPETPGHSRGGWPARGKPPVSQYAIATGVVVGVSLVNSLLGPYVGVHATALIFLLAVVLLALFVERGPTLMAAALSAAIWDYFFLPPIFAFRVSHFEDAMLLGMYFVVALVLGELTARTRAQEKATRQGEERATALYLLTRELAGAAALDEMLNKVVGQMRLAFESEIALVLIDAPNRLSQTSHPASNWSLNEKEQTLAAWTFKHRCSTRDSTADSNGAELVFLPLATSQTRLGVLGLRPNPSSSHSRDQRSLLEAFAKQIALALDRHRLQRESEKATVLAESERLSKTLLNSISHEIRTPISAIDNATSNLLEIEEPILSDPQKEMIAEIREANERLNRLVGKMLDITRLESGRVRPKLTLCDARDLIHVAVKDTRKELTQHKLTLDIAAGLPLVSIDFVLMHQVLTNLLSNAALHTPPGTAVRLSASAHEEALVISISDCGPGIESESLPRIFDKFFRGKNAPTGGTGLGLSLVKGFVEAQGGKVAAENRTEGGAVFTIRLPLNKTTLETNEAEFH